MDTELVSVIITTYKRTFEEIKPSIDSVLAQTYRSLELLIVDDNGTEGEIHRDVEKGISNMDIPGMTVIYLANDVNRGAQFSRNRGILSSHGEFIAFLDDDDLWEESKTELELKCFHEHGKETGLVFCRGWTHDSENSGERERYVNDRRFRETLRFEDLSCGDFIGTTSQVLIRREVFSACGLFDTEQSARQDYEMWIRISERYICRGVDEPLFTHVIHSGEQISKSSAKALDGICGIYRKYKRKCSRTARFFLLRRAYRAQRKISRNAFFFSLLIRLGFYFLLAWLFEREELKEKLKVL